MCVREFFSVIEWVSDYANVERVGVSVDSGW